MGIPGSLGDPGGAGPGAASQDPSGTSLSDIASLDTLVTVVDCACEARRAGAIRRPCARRGGGGVICDGGHAAPRNARGA